MSSAAPPPDRESFWSRVRKFPRSLRETPAGFVDAVWPELTGFRRKLAIVFVTIYLLLLLPFNYLLFRPARRADARLRRHATLVWRQQSPYEAVGIVRAVHNRLAEAARTRRTRDPYVVDIPPYGRFGMMGKAAVARLLYEWLVELGFYEEARAVMAERPPSEETILCQVDCLLKLERKEEAIRLLEANLELDGLGKALRRRLDVLRGTHLRTVN
jgi:hypothetical protein